MKIISRPPGGVNLKEPFLPGSGGSRNFRIPCLWAGENGRLFAAMDVRWDAEADGGGLAVAFARSDDGGESWETSFPGFFGDSGGRHDGSAATLMDPQLTVSGDTVYLLCDLFPHGRALLQGAGGADEKLSPGAGLDRNGDLLLRKRGEEEYRFHLSNGCILDEKGRKVKEYEVGPFFSLRGEGEESNLFFRGAPFEAYPTSYLCLLVSRDGGKSFEEPRLLPGKHDEEAFLGTGPGRGLVTKRGEILFPVYNGGEAGLLYSADGGKSFRRSPGVRGSESQAVELPSGKLRLFLRNPSGFLSYADFVRRDGGFVPVNEIRTGYALASNCMASAIAFEKEGKTKLALSAPSGEGLWTGRYGGRITLFDLDENEELIPASEIAVGKKEDFFAYSCLAALPGGKLGILYEDSCIRYMDKPQGAGISRAVFRKIPLGEAKT